MSTTTISPNMSLVLPTPGVDPGPDYANNQNQDLLIIDSHNHGPGSGVQITPTGLNINTNLSFQNNSPTNVYSIVFSNPSTNSNLTNLYTAPQSGGGITDLFYNDGAGNVIALTKAGLVNATIASLPGESYAGGTFTWKQGAGSTTPANFDIGSITIRPNTAGTTNGVVLGPPSGISSQYGVQLPIIPSSTSIMQLDTSGNMIATLVVDNSTLEISSQTLQIKPKGVTQGLLALRATGSTVVAGGYATSGSSGIATANNSGLQQIPNFSVTITTTGRPVVIGFTGDGTTNESTIGVQSSSTADQAFFAIERGSSVIYITGIDSPFTTSSTVLQPASSILYIDPVAAGTYTYTGQFNSGGATALALVNNAILYAYEM
jgi:hypothetical protein